MVVLVPPLPFLPPSQILSGYLSPAVCPFSSLFPLPPLRPCHSVAPSPPQQRLIPRRPSGGILRRTPPVDADHCPLLGSGTPNAEVCTPYAAGGTWLGCGLGGVEDGAPRYCP